MILQDKNVINGYVGLKKLLKKAKKTKTSFDDVFDDGESEMIKLQIVCHKIPKPQPRSELKSIKNVVPMSIKTVLPHSLTDENTTVYLITKDLKKGLKVSHEDTSRHFTDLLRENDALSMINQIMPLRQLKVEYRDYEAKRNLSQVVDVMLCDASVIRFVPQFLGKPFYEKKKHPLQVNMNSDNLKKEITKVLATTHLHLSMKGNSSAVNVGKMRHTPQQILENITAVMKKLEERFPGGLKNIKSIHMKTKNSTSIPLYVNLDEPRGEVKNPNIKNYEPVTGDSIFSTSKEVTIYPNSRIAIQSKHKKKALSKHKKNAEKEISKSQDEDENTTDKSDDEDETQTNNNNNLKKRKRTDETTDQKKQKKSKAIVSQEQSYLLRLRKEEEEIENERKKRKSKSLNKDAEEESEEEDEEVPEIIEGEDSDNETEGESDDDESEEEDTFGTFI